MTDLLADEELVTYAELRDIQQEETREIIAAVLEDGADLDDSYTIEHHFSSDDFALLESAAIAAFKLGYEVFEPEESELESGEKVWSVDFVVVGSLSVEKLDEQCAKLIDIAEKYDISYDGWGTYPEDLEDQDEE